VQWRGADDEVQQRIADVDRIYVSDSADEVLSLLHAYGATYLYVGPYERSHYAIDAHRLDWLASLLPTAYAAGDARLYTVPR
jgi:uncharacterized membrane protein